MKKTAVDWYEKEINSLFEKYEAKQISRADFLVIKHNLFYTAKEMEKQQIIKSHIDAFDNIVVDFKKQEFAEQYYQETYEQ